jgi:hypothetical protein
LFSSRKNQTLAALSLFGVKEPVAERDTKNFAAAASAKMLIQLKKYNIKMRSQIILPFKDRRFEVSINNLGLAIWQNSAGRE